MVPSSLPAHNSAFDMEIIGSSILDDSSKSMSSSDAVMPMSYPNARTSAWNESPWAKYPFNMSGDDEHVTVWEPSTGKTVAGNAAPYRKNLQTWLASHPGWEEKADALKSSKRRSAARRTKLANANFAELCKFTPLASVLINDLNGKIQEISQTTGRSISLDGKGPLCADVVLRLQEGFINVARRVHACKNDITLLGEDRWNRFAFNVDSEMDAQSLLVHAHDMITQRRSALCRDEDGIFIGSPVSAVSELSIMEGSFPEPKKGATLAVPSFLERPLRPHREPRVTVWHPSSGRTVSGNAAPCRRNLESWIKAHPGWEPKAEEQLSSSRRKKAKARPTYNSTRNMVSPASPADLTAASGLILLRENPGDTMMMDATYISDTEDDDDVTSVCSSGYASGVPIAAMDDYDIAAY